MTDVRIGARVEVFDLERISIGFGTYIREVPVAEIVSEKQWSDDEQKESGAIDLLKQIIDAGMTTPEIRLDSGATIYGIQCWWHPVEEFSTSSN